MNAAVVLSSVTVTGCTGLWTHCFKENSLHFVESLPWAFCCKQVSYQGSMGVYFTIEVGKLCLCLCPYAHDTAHSCVRLVAHDTAHSCVRLVAHDKAHSCVRPPASYSQSFSSFFSILNRIKWNLVPLTLCTPPHTDAYHLLPCVLAGHPASCSVSGHDPRAWLQGRGPASHQLPPKGHLLHLTHQASSALQHVHATAR